MTGHANLRREYALKAIPSKLRQYSIVENARGMQDSAQGRRAGSNLPQDHSDIILLGDVALHYAHLDARLPQLFDSRLRRNAWVAAPHQHEMPRVAFDHALGDSESERAEPAS